MQDEESQDVRRLGQVFDSYGRCTLKNQGLRPLAENVT